MPKIRLDKLLLDLGLVETRSEARGIIMSGKVRVAGRIADKAGAQVRQDAEVQIMPGMRFVSRGGLKLEAAHKQMRLDVCGQVCADVGASTGGFTDCLLQHGAERVYAIDVGKGVLHWKMRCHPRVVLMEETNVRYLLKLPEKVGLITMDVSFISLRLLLPVVLRWLRPGTGRILALIKPQFEAGREQVSKGGVVRSARVHRQVLRDVLGCAVANNLHPKELIQSPLRGPAGNIEFLVLLTQNDVICTIEDLILKVVSEA